jgi:hypothetical protein
MTLSIFNWNYWGYQGLFLRVHPHRIPFFVVPANHYSHVWMFWKYKKIDVLEFKFFLETRSMVFWTTVTGKNMPTFSQFLLRRNLSEKDIWISVCYADFNGAYSYKYFKMNQGDFFYFFRQNIVGLDNFFSLDPRKKIVWQKFGF